MKRYLLALDQGTTSSRCIVFDCKGKEMARAGREFRQYFPAEGFVEHDAEEIFESQLAVTREAIARAAIDPTEIVALGITNQRETVVVWDKTTGKPIHPAIVWQCRRTESECRRLNKAGLAPMIREKTGLPIDPYFSATKLAYILDHVPDARARARRGELLFGTVDTWLIYKLTNGTVHVTDPSNAARTMLFNIHTLSWDRELLRLFDIPEAMLPRVLPSVGIFGKTSPELLGASITIASAAGDQQAALFGQCCFGEGDAKNTYGTGGFLLMNTGEKPIRSKNGLLTTVGWQIGQKTAYVLEGSVFICGAAIQWLRDGLGLLASAKESEELAASVEHCGGVQFLPSFVGLGTPHWDPTVRGAVFGITRGTTRAHLVRAALEAMALQTADVLSVMQEDTGLTLPSLRVDGGAAANDLLLTMQSDFTGLSIIRPASVETTARGAAMMAGLAAGIFADLDEITSLSAVDRSFFPTLSDSARKKRLADWHAAIDAAIAYSRAITL